MSAKVHRHAAGSAPGNASERAPGPLTYRLFAPAAPAAGGLSSPLEHKPAPQSAPGGVPDSPSNNDQLRHEMESRIKDAYAKGRADGQGEAERAALARIEPALKSFQSMVQQLASQAERVRRAAEEDVVKLSIAIAQRVLRRELATDPDAILGLVKAALSKLQAREMRRLRLSPPDAAVVAAQRGKLELPQGVEIVSDALLAPGSAVFETTRGELDASIQTQLLEIDRGLTDVLRRRS